MRILITGLAAAIAGLAAVPAAAQDAAPFTGLRVEGLIGYDDLSDGDDDSDGLGYGAAIGYDFQAGGVVAGIEGEITDSSTDTRSRDLLVPGDNIRLSAGRDLYAGGRVGYVISPLAMAYAKAGYTNAKFDLRYDGGTVRIRDTAELDGLRLGAGLEYQFGPNSFVKGEYRYSNYGDERDYDVDVDRHQLVAGVGFRF